MIAVTAFFLVYFLALSPNMNGANARLHHTTDKTKKKNKNKTKRAAAPEGGKQRNLQRSNKITWPECESNQLTALQCKTLIESEAASHEIPDLNVEVIYPRNTTVMEHSYWRIGILTNYAGKVIGTEGDGVIRYAEGTWQGIGPLGTRQIGPWNCGMYNNANECCNVIKMHVYDRDVNGNYISCYVTQDDPTPYIKPNGQLSYCQLEWDPVKKKYNPQDVSLATLQAEDKKIKDALRYNILYYQRFNLDGSMDYDMLKLMNNSCHKNGRGLESIQALCNKMDLFLNPPNRPGHTLQVDWDLHKLSQDLKNALTPYVEEPYAPEHKITIYAGNEQGDYVVGNPGVGSHGKPNSPGCKPN